MVEEVNGAMFSAKNSQQSSSVTNCSSDETMILENCNDYSIIIILLRYLLIRCELYNPLEFASINFQAIILY